MNDKIKTYDAMEENERTPGLFLALALLLTVLAPACVLVVMIIGWMNK